MDNESIRAAAFKWLSEQVEIHGEVLPWALLLLGFIYRGERVPLLSQQGIFKPRVMELPLSLRHSQSGPYVDRFTGDGSLGYQYRGQDPQHVDNRGLREAMRRQLPLVYLHGIDKGKYVPVWPDYRIVVQPRILAEEDGPMLLHGLQGFHQKRIVVPRSAALKPDPALLEERYGRFLAVAGG